MKQVQDYTGRHLYNELEVSDISAILHTSPVYYGRNLDGYGRKIPLANMVVLTTSKRKYRVYAVCYSNTATLYILVKGRMVMCETALNDFGGEK